MSPDEIARAKARDALLNDPELLWIVQTPNLLIRYAPILPTQPSVSYTELTPGLYLVEESIDDLYVDEDGVMGVDESIAYNLFVTDPELIGVSIQDLSQFNQNKFAK